LRAKKRVIFGDTKICVKFFFRGGKKPIKERIQIINQSITRERRKTMGKNQYYNNKNAPFPFTLNSVNKQYDIYFEFSMGKYARKTQISILRWLMFQSEHIYLCYR